MGNEHSKSKLPLLEGETIEVTDSYVLRQGTLCNGERCSVFSGSQSAALLSLSQNLKTHRHPSILKFASSGQQKDQLYLVTEQVRPLSVVLSGLSALQICVGLHSILTALSFLHVQAQTSHNNVCIASLFVTAQGVWKLSGLEFMLKFTGTTYQSLSELRSRRYDKSIPPEESNGRIIAPAVDVYGFGVLSDELLQRFDDDDLPGLGEFRSYCKERMLEKDPRNRLKLSQIVAHPFFSHDFIRIHKFLVELPLKTSEEKLEFFRELEHQLKLLPESMVASQLIPLLLARIVVLDSAAQQHLLPILLKPRSDDHLDVGLFSDPIYREFVVPKLLHMFCVRDASVRLLLLSYLPSFIHTFTHEQLRFQLLPELLLGIKDVDDDLVIATLQSLATLVGILGGAAVVGGQRARLFSDGRPATRRPRRETALPERPSPDGGEDEAPEDTPETWSDWEQQSEKEPEMIKEQSDLVELEPSVISSTSTPSKSNRLTPRTSVDARPPTTLADIDALDIKSSTSWRASGEDDFFRDMEPVISKTQVATIKEDKFGVTAGDSAGEAWETFEDWEGVPE